LQDSIDFQYSSKVESLAGNHTIDFFGITEITTPTIFDSDGWLGLGPYTAQWYNQSQNFVFQLKQKGIIDHATVSIYTSSGGGNSSSIKFGSYDNGAMVFPMTPKVIPTINKQSWAVEMSSLSFTTL
jgi:hypothetical protein